jgi:hypothetical protein
MLGKRKEESKQQCRTQDLIVIPSVHPPPGGGAENALLTGIA